MYTMFRNFFIRNFFMKNKGNKCMIVIHKNLNLTDVKVKPIPNKERYETIDY